MHKTCTIRPTIFLLDWWNFSINIVVSGFLRPCHHYLSPFGCWFLKVESGGHPPQHLKNRWLVHSPHLPGCLGCWVLMIGNNLGECVAVISILKRVGHGVPNSKGSHLLPEELGSGEPVSWLRPWDINNEYCSEHWPSKMLYSQGRILGSFMSVLFRALAKC